MLLRDDTVTVAPGVVAACCKLPRSSHTRKIRSVTQNCFLYIEWICLLFGTFK